MLAGMTPEATHSRAGGMRVNETRDHWQAAVTGTFHKLQRQPSSPHKPTTAMQRHLNTRHSPWVPKEGKATWV